MNILLTGAYGNIGLHTIEALLAAGHNVRAFDLPTRAHRRAARRIQGSFDPFWGDICDPASIAAAVTGMDAVIHLAFIIPRLSDTGINSEDAPDLAFRVNVGGTRNLIDAMEACAPSPRLIFTSSLHIYGPTQHLDPPRRITDSPNPTEHYARHKVECEKLVRSSSLTWSIYRLGAALPVRLILDMGVFEVPLDNRIEIVHPRDVAHALAHGLDGSYIWGRTFHIGGGPACQYIYREVAEKVLHAAGVGMLPDRAFTREPFSIDWLDTEESQALLDFQRHTLEDYLQDVRAKVGALRPLIRLTAPLVRAYMVKQSPYTDGSGPLPSRPLPTVD